MSEITHATQSDYKGTYYKYESPKYRGICQGCGRGYHGNRWDAHHVLPGTCFSEIPALDTYANDCLKLTDYNINEKYSMAGLPKLTAFILFYQRPEQNVRYVEALETTVTMRRWGTVRRYKSQAHLPIVFPGNFPVHNPVSFGHTHYNVQVTKYIRDEIFSKLKNREPHPKPQEVRAQLMQAQRIFWTQLVKRGSGVGGGGLSGIDANFRERYDAAKNGWWRPMSMSAQVTSAPVSPSLA